ncbi:prolyl oligopeptidase family serine peptidase [Flammeovirgaceae bacterium SG7u.111]|nr:prolyl oligopeptidase family serine peptidase [Flammeovirgaceae bacterium SG7u.132]WPO34464.1 prolyl oligopeptidase family serine peptidase [Flammeovirgaceae bacterium SG7u.111]
MKKILIAAILLVASSSTFAQEAKKVLTHEVYDDWKRVGNKSISTEGNWLLYSLRPQHGDETLKIKNSKSTSEFSFERASGAAFSYDEKYVVATLKPHLDSLAEMRRRKVEDSDLPTDSLLIVGLSKPDTVRIAEVASFQLPEKAGGWLAYLLKEQKVEKDTSLVAGDSVAIANMPEPKQESEENGTKLILRELETGRQDTFMYVTEYSLSKTGTGLMFHSTGDDSLFQKGVYLYDISNKALQPMMRGEATFSHLTWDETGSQLSFLADTDTTEAQIRKFGLYYWTNSLDSAQKLIDESSNVALDGWVVNQYYAPHFSRDGFKLYFGFSPEPVLQDTLLLEEEIVNVEVWGYKDTYLQTQQNIEAEMEKKRAYLAMYDLGDEVASLLGSPEVPEIILAAEGNADVALGYSNLPYGQALSWDGYPPYNDIYLVDVRSGGKTKVAAKVKGNPRISPEGRFFYWYSATDTAWFTYDITKKQLSNLSGSIDNQFYSEFHDYPDYPSSYGSAGWTKGDEKFLIYDRYDIWAFDPSVEGKAERITQNGRETNTSYRYIHFDDEIKYIDSKKPILLHGTQAKSRAEGFYQLDYKKKITLTKLYETEHALSNPIKAKNSDELLFTMESYVKFPDVQLSDLSFENVKEVSKANPQQADYQWGTAEVVTWVSLDGIPLEGLLYKPEGFDPNKKYPLLVNFYERNSHNLHRHRIPEPHRSTINYPYYVSNGYVIFVPDIPYKVGYPGQSCFNAVMPGVTNLISQGYIDKDNIGVQGHSWGGYQVAYLVTRTDLFKAAESGAPVPNMISAYGGIRWWTGLSRMFQYENTQSRIGGTIWEYPLRYLENSPIFTLDKVNTPLLIMHNDADGHVPWYQGIELFVGMRRLGKPAWMLNYNGEPHWPLKWQNQKDFAIRMGQFFDHYLKGEPIPQWMGSGVPAIHKGIKSGYEPVGKNEE